MSSAHSVFTHLIVLSIHARAEQFNCSESLRSGGLRRTRRTHMRSSMGRPQIRGAGRVQAAFTSFSTAEITESSRLQNEKRTR